MTAKPIFLSCTVITTVAALAALAGGCGRTGSGTGPSHRDSVTTAPGPSQSRTPDSSATPVLTCGGPLAGMEPPGPGAGLPSAAGGGPLPKHFTPVTAGRCVRAVEPVPGDGDWLVRHDQRATSGLAALATALRLPPEKAEPGVACAAIGTAPLTVALTDAHGRTVVPTVPNGPCGAPLPAVTKAVAALPWRTVATTRLVRVRSQLSVDSGCPTTYKPVVAMDDPAPATSLPPAPHGPTRPASYELCRYRLDPRSTLGTATASYHTGILDGAVRLTGRTLTAVSTALADSPAVTAGCRAAQPPFAVLIPSGDGTPTPVVELGGCRRFDDGTGALHQLDAATVALLVKA
jgi:hypothetical protein